MSLQARPDHDTTAGAESTHDDFGGLGRDSAELAARDAAGRRVIARRSALPILGGIGVAGLVAACSTSDPSSAGAPSSSTTAVAASATQAAGASQGVAIPEETAGPYPADGSNGPNVLTDGAVVRSDLTTSFGSHDGTAEGIPTQVELSIVDAGTGDPMPASAVYLWHCTAGGEYSIYEVRDQNYLRGVQEADDAGKVAYTTVFPGCYRGRWPHMHFEVYENLAEANRGSNAVRTSQLALPQADCETAYAQPEYGSSASNLGQLSLSRDNVFSDGWTEQLATVSGTPTDGYRVSLLVRV